MGRGSERSGRDKRGSAQKGGAGFGGRWPRESSSFSTRSAISCKKWWWLWGRGTVSEGEPLELQQRQQPRHRPDWSSRVEVSSQTWLSLTDDQNLLRPKPAKNLSCLDFALCPVLFKGLGPLGITPAELCESCVSQSPHLLLVSSCHMVASLSTT